MWSARACRSSTSPPVIATAARNVAASTRSGIVSCFVGRERLDAFDLDRRRARALDLRAHRVEKVGQVGDLGLARRVLDHGRALRQRGRHEDVLGRTDARELERHRRARQAIRRAPTYRARARTSRRAPRDPTGACRSGANRSRRRRGAPRAPRRTARAADRARRSTRASARRGDTAPRDGARPASATRWWCPRVRTRRRSRRAARPSSPRRRCEGRSSARAHRARATSPP